MKDFNLLIWLTQLGLSVALPLAGFILLGVWLHESRGWGVWTVWVGISLGIVCGGAGFRDSLKAMGWMSKQKKDNETSPVSFNDHT